MSLPNGIMAFLMMLASFFGCGIMDEVLPTEPPMDDSPTFQSYVVVTSADALILESFPPQVTITVTGYHSDGCNYPAIVDQRQEGNHFTVEIYREVPLAAMCPAVQVDYEVSIPLGTFEESGTYTVDINGYLIEFTV